MDPLPTDIAELIQQAITLSNQRITSAQAKATANAGNTAQVTYHTGVATQYTAVRDVLQGILVGNY